MVEDNCQFPISNCKVENKVGSAPQLTIGNRPLEINICKSQISNFKLPQDDDRLRSAYAALESVTDPEIPIINVVEMGMIAGVRVDGERLVVDLTPTFVGCPAIDVITSSIREAMHSIGETEAAVNVVYEPPWSSDRISEEGRRKLKEFGLAPPGGRCADGATSLERVACPFCNSKNTSLESIFGPTLCRSIHYCQSCLQSFEHFKPV